MKALENIWHLYVEGYYLWSTGVIIMTVMNYTLLSINAGTAVKGYLQISQPTTWVIAGLMVLGMFGVVAFGFFLDRIGQVNRRMTDRGNDRNVILLEMNERLKRIEEKL